MGKHVEPTVTATAFSCPYCGTLTSQAWSKLNAYRYDRDPKHPFIPDDSVLDRIAADKDFPADEKKKLEKYFRRILSGDVFYDEVDSSISPHSKVANLHLSQCYECKKIAVWRQDTLLFPNVQLGVDPNEDLDDDIKRDFNEAREISNISPRGAAALLRLVVQKLCKQLGEAGKNIDHDIASLVAKGLSPVIQQSLDVVRVIGNESVHPGVLDLRDDRDTALHLLSLINTIAEQMITHPKHVQSLYDKLPAEKRAGIDKRNAKALNRGSPSD